MYSLCKPLNKKSQSAVAEMYPCGQETPMDGILRSLKVLKVNEILYLIHFQWKLGP